MSTAAYSLPASPAISSDQVAVHSPWRQQLRSIAVDTLVPLAIYAVTRRYFGLSEIEALLATVAQPIVSGVRTLRNASRLSPTQVLIFAGILVNLFALALGGNAQVLLLRESLLTAALGVACLASLPTQRPLIFFFVRHFQAGNDGTAAAAFNARLHQKPFLHSMRVMSAVWGLAMLGEFSLRAWMVWHCAPGTVLAVSPVLLNGTIFGTIAWSVWYGKRRQARVAAQTAPLPV